MFEKNADFCTQLKKREVHKIKWHHSVCSVNCYLLYYNTIRINGVWLLLHIYDASEYIYFMLVNLIPIEMIEIESDSNVFLKLRNIKLTMNSLLNGANQWNGMIRMIAIKSFKNGIFIAASVGIMNPANRGVSDKSLCGHIKIWRSPSWGNLIEIC